MLLHLCSVHSFFPWLTETELPTNGIGMAYEPFEDSASQPIDFLHIAPLLWTEAHNLPGLQPTVIEQIGQAPLTWTSQHGLDDLPNLAAAGPVFHVGLARLPWLW